jgi:hypothetical protein
MSVAEAVQTTTKASISTSSGFVLQRKCACGGSSSFSVECEECKRNKLLGKPLQRKLAINEPGDEYEREADRVAEQVMRMPDPERRPGVAESPRAPLVQRRVKGGGATGLGTAPQIVHNVLSSPGQPLDAATRSFFEPRFGHDFSQVRVHSDIKAAKSARAVNAQAYTVGNHVVFGGSVTQPRRNSGLLAHELTHVVQQGSALYQGMRLEYSPYSSSNPAFASEMVDGSIRSGLATSKKMIQRASAGEIFSSIAASGSEVAIQLALEALGVLDQAHIAAGMERALRNPIISALILKHPAIAVHRKSIAFLQATPGALEAIWAFIQNPDPYKEHIKKSLEPHIREAQHLAVAQGNQLLDQLGVPAEYHASVWKVLKHAAGLAESAFGFVINEIILDTVLFWQLRSEHEIYDEAWKKYKEGTIDAVDLVIEHLSIVLNVIGRIEDLMPLVLAAVGAVSGGAIGGAGGSVVPVAGTTAGAGGGSGAGGTAGLAVSEVLGIVAGLGPGALEVTKAAKAGVELALKEQDEKQRHQDFGQIASSAMSLIVMAVLAFLPGLALRLGRKLSRKLIGLLPDVAEILPQPKSLMLAAPPRAEPGRTAAGTMIEVRPETQLSAMSSSKEVMVTAEIEGPPRLSDETSVSASPERSLEPTDGQAARTEQKSSRADGSEERSAGQIPILAKRAAELDASIAISSKKESDKLSMQEKRNEADWVQAHPEVVTINGTPPHREARIGENGEHRIVEEGTGRCVRHSYLGYLTLCPVPWIIEASPNQVSAMSKEGYLLTSHPLSWTRREMSSSVTDPRLGIEDWGVLESPSIPSAFQGMPLTGMPSSLLPRTLPILPPPIRAALTGMGPAPIGEGEVALGRLIQQAGDKASYTQDVLVNPVFIMLRMRSEIARIKDRLSSQNAILKAYSNELRKLEENLAKFIEDVDALEDVLNLEDRTQLATLAGYVSGLRNATHAKTEDGLIKAFDKYMEEYGKYFAWKIEPAIEKIERLKRRLEIRDKLVTQLSKQLPALRYFNDPRVDVPIGPSLPEPRAGRSYVPTVISGDSEATALSHINGYKAEISLANRVAETEGHIVVKYGDAIGRHGSDVISVDPLTGAVTLWDSKWSGKGAEEEISGTFQGDPLADAIREAFAEILQADNLNQELKGKAVEYLKKGIFTARTVSSTGDFTSGTFRITREVVTKFKDGKQVQ